MNANKFIPLTGLMLALVAIAAIVMLDVTRPEASLELNSQPTLLYVYTDVLPSGSEA